LTIRIYCGILILGDTVELTLGENRNIYIVVSSASNLAFTIESAYYTVFSAVDESVVASGVASIEDYTVYATWQPSVTGIYVVDFNYVIGDESITSRQVVHVRETLS